jgi:D-beta-D-heptose 7-phosphate kinase/D-beta-D-heptose 1-phosphate adenosyltransferase
MKIFVNGTFDILHVGHLRLLNFAKAQGSHLTIGIDSDRRVKQLKGPTRPINTVDERMEMLYNLSCVDSVKVFDSDEDLIALIADCDIMVKGSDYKGRPIVGEDVCKQILFFDRIDEYSTTGKIQRIISG